MRSLHVAVAQINSRTGQVDETFARLRRQATAAAAVGAELILFAETALHSYDLHPENMARAEPLDGPLIGRVAALARELKLIIVPGFFERAGSQRFNSQAVCWPDGRRAVVRKHVLTPKETAAGLAPGPVEREVFRFNGISTVIVICADSGSKELKQFLADRKVELTLHPTAGGDLIFGRKTAPLAEADLATAAGREYARKYRKCVFLADYLSDPDDVPRAFASANALGYDGRDVTNLGHCIIVDRFGTMRAQIPGTVVREHQEDQMVHATLTWPDA